MKKLLTIVLSALAFVGCSSNNSQGSISNDGGTSNKTINPGDSNVLVAYFSVTNNTKKLATYAQEHLQSDIFEIVPKVEYTSADIDYNSDCRANKEQNDDMARPEIKYTIEDISQYDTIVLGYPIWWAQAPKIMYTFIESYDFTNKTILPFCTSGSSDIGSSATNLAKSAPKANWLDGKRFAASTNKTTISGWLDEYIDKKEDNMNLYIDNQKLNVTWEDNDSVKALKKILPVTINMHQYGGFEQTGNIGQSIARNDTEIDTVPGDIVLYNGNAISVFYDNSSWSYTRLGHINLSISELNTLLNKSAVVFELKNN
jgi:flavodoxin